MTLLTADGNDQTERLGSPFARSKFEGRVPAYRSLSAMQNVLYPERLQSALRAQPPLEFAAKSGGVDVYVVWRAAPKYLVECIQQVARSFDFHIDGIAAEKRVVCQLDDCTKQVRSLRRVRLRYAGTREQFFVGLLAVLEEIERVCPWVHVTRLDRRALDANRDVA